MEGNERRKSDLFGNVAIFEIRRKSVCGLNASTDYAIRMLICLSRASGVVSSSKLAKAIGVSPRYLLQIGARLREAGFVHVGHGPAGGYQLSRPPAKISLMDVIMAMYRKGNVPVLPDKR